MPIREIHKQNLAHCIARLEWRDADGVAHVGGRGAQTAAAALFGVRQGDLSNWLSPRRAFPPDRARQAEKIFNLAPGSFDSPLDGAAAASTDRPELAHGVDVALAAFDIVTARLRKAGLTGADIPHDELMEMVSQEAAGIVALGNRAATGKR